MKVFFSTDWTTNDSLLTEVDNVITLHPQGVKLSDSNVCLIAENELGEIIATSGCGEEEPLITERFIRFWANEGFPAEMDIEISELYLEDNQLTEISSEIYLETNQPFVSTLPSNTPANWIENALQEEIPVLHDYESEDQKELFYSLPQITSETEAHLLEVEEFYRENPTGGNIVMEVWEKKDFQSSQITQDMLERMEHEARQNMKKHVLVKRKDLPKRVDFEMLVNSSHLIWNAGHLLGISEDPNNPTVSEGQEAVKNFLLFLQLMKNPKFATRASFEIEKLLSHGKN